MVTERKDNMADAINDAIEIGVIDKENYRITHSLPLTFKFPDETLEGEITLNISVPSRALTEMRAIDNFIEGHLKFIAEDILESIKGRVSSGTIDRNL